MARMVYRGQDRSAWRRRLGGDASAFAAAGVWLAVLVAVGALGAGCEGDAASGPAPPLGTPCADPGAVESCFPGAPTARGVGSCRDGERRCVDGLWTQCVGYVLPTDERCADDGDEGDENCNGVIDDGCACESDTQPDPCYGGPPTTRGIGLCQDGVPQCIDGFWSDECDGEVLPVVEGCNTTDDDCDGEIDEGCSCTDGQVQSCYGGPNGTADVGACRSGTQQCVGGGWPVGCAGQVLPTAESCNGIDDDCDGETDEGDPGGGLECATGQPGPCADGITHCDAGAASCVALVTPTAETCDGRDENCNGALDDGTFLPASYDAFEWIPAGWFNLEEGALVVWGSRCALWDAASGEVLLVSDLVNTWNAFGTNGTQPPTSSITALLALPAGAFGAETDSLWVAADTTLYTIDTGSTVWQSASISASVGITDRIDSMTSFFAGDIPGSVEDTLAIIRQSQTWLYSASGGWGVPMVTADVFCLPGSTGSCPPGVSNLSRLPGAPAGVLVGYGSQTWTSPWRSDAAGLHYDWSTSSLSAISCAH